MRSTVLWLALAIVATAVGGLVLFGDSGSVLGMEPDHFASLARLSVVLLIAAVVVAGFRGQVRPRLWHAAFWLATIVALMAGWQAFHGGL